jgi:hypothetical protein
MNNSVTTDEKDIAAGRFSSLDPMGLGIHIGSGLGPRAQSQLVPGGGNQIELRIPPKAVVPVARPCELVDEQKQELKEALGIQAKFVPTKEAETSVDEDLELDELQDGDTDKFWKGKATVSLPFLIAESAYNMYTGYN